MSIKVDRVADDTSDNVGSPIIDNESGMRATFSSIEYSDRDVPNIIPKGSEMLSRKSIVVTPIEDSPPAYSPPAASGETTHLGRSKSVHATPTAASSNIISSVSKPGKSAFERRKTANEGDSDIDDDDDEEEEEEEEEDEFYDCRENLDDDSVSSLAKWSSMDLLPYGDGEKEEEEGGGSSGSSGVQRANRPPPISTGMHPAVAARTEPHVTFRRVQSMREQSSKDECAGPRSPPHSAGTKGGGGAVGVKPGQADPADVGVCPTTVLILVAHGGSVLDLDMDVSVRKSDVTTFRGAFESVMRTHYPWMVGHVAIKCVRCPAVCSEALAVLSSLSPYR